MLPCPPLPDVLRALGLLAWLLVHHIPTLVSGGALAAIIFVIATKQLNNPTRQVVCAIIGIVLALFVMAAADPSLCAWWEAGLVRAGADTALETADAKISKFTGCLPHAGVTACLAMAAPPGVWWPHLRGLTLTEEEVDSRRRRAYFMSLLLMLPLATGIAVQILQFLAAKARSSEPTEPSYLEIGLVQDKPPQLPLAVHFGYNVYCCGLACLCFWLGGASLSSGFLWEVYVVWQASVLAINIALAIYVLRTKKLYEMPSLAQAVVEPITPLGELFDCFKDWLFVGLSASLGSVAGVVVGCIAMLVLLTSNWIMRALHPDDLLKTYFPVMGPKPAPLVRPGLAGKALQLLEKVSEPAKITSAMTENMPQAFLQSFLAWFASSSSQLVTLALTVFKLLVTCAAYVPARLANDRVTSVAVVRAGLWRRLHDLCRRMLGNQNPQTSACMERHARALRDSGDLQGAAELGSQCFELRKEVFGEQHPSTLASMELLARALLGTGDYQGAAELGRQCLELQKEVLGDRHPSTLESMELLARALLGTGDSQGAAALGRQCLELQKEVRGDRHPSTLESMDLLARALFGTGDYQGAAALARQCVELLEDVVGERHPNTLRSMDLLARALLETGDRQGAAALARRCLELRKEVLGERHPSTLESMDLLARALFDTGDYQGAAALGRQCLELQKDALGDRHPSTLESMGLLATALGRSGDSQGAAALGRQCLQLQKDALGERHPSTLASMELLAGALFGTGDYQGAAALGRQCLELRKEVLGERHPDTLYSMELLAQALSAAGDSQGAAELGR